VKGATIDVSNDWALWLRANRRSFAHVSMLTGAPFVQLTAKFVQRFAELNDIMRLYTDAAAFDAALAGSQSRIRQV
jgi:phage regulator Rha-like protein